MKKFLAVLLSLILGTAMLAFAACADNAPSGNTPSGNDGQTTPGGPETPADPGEGNTPESPDTPGTPVTDGSVLVVYFSATGNTERVANYIVQATGSDIFELVPVEPYTDSDLNWTDDNSRVVREHENEALQNSVELVSATPGNWDEYDTVFIGYPIWWGIAAWPVNGFVTANDFTGKTVVPFCTASSSDIGDSGSLLADMAGEGNWIAGHRFRSSASESDVRDWLGDLGAI